MSQDSALMLKTSLAVLRSQWEFVKEQRQYKNAYKEG
jgi:hypothetical protein